MNILIVKLGATGDVVRTTTLLRALKGEVTWLTAAKNTTLFDGVKEVRRCFSWEQREAVRDVTYGLVINLEDTVEIGTFLKSVEFDKLFGAYVDDTGELRYTDDARRWFDLSLISIYGKEQADQLKLKNRHTYQELIFEGLGFQFQGEKYVLPKPVDTGLGGDVAIAREAGPVWPMKNWAYYDKLKNELEARGLKVNFLQPRYSLREHLADVCQHRCFVGGDSLPMHFALGTGIRCVTIFTCTSPWEIFDYGIQTKIVSPLLEEYFYKRGFDSRATTAVSLEEVLTAVLKQVELAR